MKLLLNHRKAIAINLIGISIACIVYIILALVAFDFTIDDTFISMRYAKNIVDSGELVWNKGEVPRTEGYTSLLWVLMCAFLFRVVQTDFIHWVKCLSLFWGMLALMMTTFVGYRLFHNKALCAFPSLLLAVTIPMILWGVSGMETSLYVFLVVLTLYLLIREEDGKLNFLTPFILFLISITRTEGIVFYCSIVFIRVLFAIYYRDKRYYLTDRRYIIWNFIFLFCFVCYIMWKMVYYGSFIPLPVYVKKATDYQGIIYVIKHFIGYLFPYFVLAFIGIIRNIGNRKLFYLIIPLLCYLMAISAATPIMGLFARLLLAGFPIMYLLSSLELDNILTSIKYNTIKKVFLILFLISLFFPLINNPRIYYQTLISSNTYGNLLKNVHIPLGLWLKEYNRFKDNITLAVADAGAIPFYSELNCIDFYGLNDIEFAKKGFSAERLLQRCPDFIILKSCSNSTFKGTDTPYGRYSDMIFNNKIFKENYQFNRKFTNNNPFYSLWVFERKNGG
jgi:hypothetical protein